MTSPLRYKFQKIVKIIVTTIATILGVFFIFSFCATYFLLSSLDKKVTIENKKILSQDKAAPNTSNPSSTTSTDDLSATKPQQQIFTSQELADNIKFKQKILFIKEIIKLRKDPRFESAPPICEIICNISTWERKSENEQSLNQFNSFLDKEGSRAFDDPKFRLAFELVNAYSDLLIIISESVEQIEPLMNAQNELSIPEKTYWSAYAPILIARAAVKTEELFPKSEKQSVIVKELIQLNKQCDVRSLIEIKESCQALTENLN